MRPLRFTWPEWHITNAAALSKGACLARSIAQLRDDGKLRAQRRLRGGCPARAAAGAHLRALISAGQAAPRLRNSLLREGAPMLYRRF